MQLSELEGRLPPSPQMASLRVLVRTANILLSYGASWAHILYFPFCIGPNCNLNLCPTPYCTHCSFCVDDPGNVSTEIRIICRDTASSGLVLHREKLELRSLREEGILPCHLHLLAEPDFSDEGLPMLFVIGPSVSCFSGLSICFSGVSGM
jgi:hypothetical protein